MRIVRGLGVALVVVTLLGATNVFGANISGIGALSPASGGTVDSRVYAISPDGKYAVGASNGQVIAGSATISQAVIWSAGSGLVQLPNAADQATSARGVVVKANGDVGVGGYYNDPGFTPYRMAFYTTTPANLAGGTWTPHASHNLVVGTYNASRMYEDGTGDTWSTVGQRGNSNRAIQALSDGSSYSDSGGVSGFNRIYNVASRTPVGSGRGAAAGYVINNSTGLRSALFGVTGSTQTTLPGGAGYQSEALGMSPYTTTTANSGVIVGYDQDATASHYKHAFYYPQGAAGMTLLPELAGDNQSEAIDVRVISGNRIIGGYSSNGTLETAVLWDSTGIWDATGQPKALSTLVNMNEWTSLSRITSMSDDGMTLGGWGVWAADGSTRGFVVTIPEPATLVLLTLGGISFLRRNRH